MKDALEFVSKLLRKGGDEDFNNIHICGANIQTTDGVVTLSHPIKHTNYEATSSKDTFTVNGLNFKNVMEACNYIDVDLFLKDNNLIIKKKEINLLSKLPYSTDHTPKKISKKALKKHRKIPDEFISFIRSMTKFTVKDSDNIFASSINVIGKRLFATNNISIIKSKLKAKLPDCTIPRPLINVILNIKLNPEGFVLTDTEIIFLYANGSYAMCQKVTETIPDLSAIFNDFKRPKAVPDIDMESLKRTILTDSNDEITCKKGVLSNDNITIKDTTLSSFKVDTDNLEYLLKVFKKVRFGTPFSYFESDEYLAVLAGRA